MEMYVPNLFKFFLHRYSHTIEIKNPTIKSVITTDTITIFTTLSNVYSQVIFEWLFKLINFK